MLLNDKGIKAQRCSFYRPGILMILREELKKDNRTIDEWRREIVESLVTASGLVTKVIMLELKERIEGQGILPRIAMLVAGARLKKEMAPYVGAVFFLLTVGKQITEENIDAALGGVGISPVRRYMDFVLSLNFENHIVAYAPFIPYLKIVRMPVTVENMMKIAADAEIEPDRKTAGKVLNIYLGSLNASVDGRSADLSPEEEAMVKSSHDAALVISKIPVGELDRTIADKNFRKYFEKGMMYYLVSSGTLSFISAATLGDEAYDKGFGYIARMVKTIGVEPEQEVFDYMKSLGYGYSNGYHCVPAIYYLVSLGIEPSLDSVGKLVDSIGMHSEDALIGFILETYSEYVSSGKGTV